MAAWLRRALRRRALSSRRGPKSGANSPASIRRSSSARPPFRKNAGPRPGASSPIEKDRQVELLADPARELTRGLLRTRHVLGHDRHERDDVGCADPRMSPLVAAEIDAVARACDPRQEGLHELLVLADEREDRAVVVGVGVDVEQLGVLCERSRDGVDRRPVAPLREVRHRFERQRHGRTLGA